MLKKVCAVVAAAAVTLGAVSVPCSAAATLEATWQLYGATGFEEYSAFKADGMEGFAAGDMTVGNPTGANGKVLNSLTVAEDSAMGGNALVAELNPEINKVNSGYGTLNGTWQKQGAILIGGKAGAADGNGISKYAYLFDTVGTSYRVSCDAVAYGLETGTKALVKMRSMSNMNDRCMVGGAQDYIDYDGQEINTVKNREDIKKTDFKRVSWEFTAKQVKDGAVILIEFPETDVSKEQAYIMLDNLVVERRLSNLSVERGQWLDASWNFINDDLLRVNGVNAKERWAHNSASLGSVCYIKIDSSEYAEGGAMITSSLLNFVGDDIGTTKVNIGFRVMATSLENAGDLPLNIKIKDKNDNVLVSKKDFCPGYQETAISDPGKMKDVEYSFTVDEQTVDAAKIELTVSGIEKKTGEGEQLVTMILDDVRISVAPSDITLKGENSRDWNTDEFTFNRVNNTGWFYTGAYYIGNVFYCSETKEGATESGVEITSKTFLENITEDDYGKTLSLDFGAAVWDLTQEADVNLEVRAADAGGNTVDCRKYTVKGNKAVSINDVPGNSVAWIDYAIDVNEKTSKIKKITVAVTDIDKMSSIIGEAGLRFAFKNFTFRLVAPNASIKNMDNGCMVYEKTPSSNAYMTGTYRTDGTLEGAAYDTANRYLLPFSDSTASVKAFLFEDLIGIKPLAEPIYKSR